jgi:hypothetical protein
MSDRLKVTHEQMRSPVVEALIDPKADRSQFAELPEMVGALAIRHGLAQRPAGGGPPGRVLSWPQFLDLMWDLMIEGIIRPGRDDSNLELPHYHLTDFGKHVIKHGPQSPYDPDGYLARLKQEVPLVDGVILTYLNESLHTLRIGCLLSSTVTLGCAAEKALLLLIATYADSLPAPRQQKFRVKTEGQMIKRQFDEFRKHFEGDLRGRLPQELLEGLDIELVGLFELIRQQRNDAGHPTGKMPKRESAYANLQLFLTYARKLYALIEWVKQNSLPP